jgi:hypothetical protein
MWAGLHSNGTPIALRYCYSRKSLAFASYLLSVIAANPAELDCCAYKNEPNSENPRNASIKYFGSSWLCLLPFSYFQICAREIEEGWHFPRKPAVRCLPPPFRNHHREIAPTYGVLVRRNGDGAFVLRRWVHSLSYQLSAPCRTIQKGKSSDLVPARLRAPMPS